MAHANADRDTNLGNIITLTAAGSGTVTGQQIDGSNGRGVLLFVNISAISGTTPTLTVTLKGLDPNGNAYTILASSALNATGLTVLKVYPALTAAANTVANDVLPVSWRVDYTIGGTSPSVTGTIAANLLY